MVVWCLVAALALGQDCPDTGAQADCDGDGWSLAQGDCDDDNQKINPGASEVCDDRKDNDCNGYFDEDCESGARMGTLQGGGGCTGGGAAFMLPLFGLGWARRRR
jgi:uncharacterized protein (TIGR03382 family)